MGPLLSIVIPTRNREFYCIKAIKNILEYRYDRLELVVQDNSDSDIIEHYATTVQDKRLIYNRVTERINSVINMDAALSLATGKYVIMIGDDDTILPCIFDVVSWMDKNDVCAFSPKRQQSFVWNEDGLGIYVTYPSKNKLKVYDAKSQLQLLLKNGIIDYQSYYLPRVYHGIVKRDLLQSLYNLTSHYIGGLSPDIYLSVALSLITENYIVAEFPISIQGICSKSTAFAGKKGTHRGKLEDAPHLYKRGEYIWDSRIPAVYSIETIWAETALKSIQEIADSPDFWGNQFNRRYFNTVFILKNRNLCKELPEETSGLRINFRDFFRYVFKRSLIMARSLYWRISGQRKVYKEVAAWKSVKNIEMSNNKKFL